MRRFWTGTLLVTCLLGAPLLGSDRPSALSKALSAVLSAVSDAGYTAVTEVSYDDGQWEVEALNGGRPVGLRIDPQTLKLLNEHPDEPHPRVPSDAPPLINIIKRLEKEGYSPIKKAELDLAGWEIEALHQGGWRELIVSTDGRILSDRRED